MHKFPPRGLNKVYLYLYLYGISTVLRTDNSPQNCRTVQRLLRKLRHFSLSTNSQRLWHKASDKYLALLDYRTTPLESVGLSPAQLLMGRRPRNKLPSAQQLLMPRAYDPRKVKHQLDRCKASQKLYYDNSRASKHRLPLTPGEEVRMQPYPGNPKWSPAVVIQKHTAARSYIVDCGRKEFCRNSQHLRRSTSVANQSRHFPSDEPWAEPNQEMFSPTADNVMVPIPEKPPDSGQMLPYTTKSGRVVKPPQRLDL
uniref:Uncharacterized protein n=1 Tax=Labrus bergylta TaxID=56723 RepID=A0A3Q3EFZ3_9LABR